MKNTVIQRYFHALLIVCCIIFSICFTCKSFAQEPRLLYSQKLVDGDIPICMKVVVNENLDLSTIFDTGASAQLFFDRSLTYLSDDFQRSAKINNGSLTGSIRKLDSIKFGDLLIEGPEAVFIDLSGSMKYLVPEPHAVVGTGLFQRACFSFNFDECKLEVFDGSIAGSKEMNFITMFKNPDGALYFKTKLHDEEMNFVIDTGFNGAMRVPRATYDEWVTKELIDSAKMSGSIATLQGKSDTLSGRFKKGQFMGISMVGVEVISTHENLPFILLGLNFLRRFNFTLDLHGMRFGFIPRVSVTTLPPLDLLLGARLIYSQKGCEIEKLKPGGGLFENAGVKEGDRLLSFGSLTSSELSMPLVHDYCSKYLGGVIEIRIQRQGETRVIKLPPLQATIP